MCFELLRSYSLSALNDNLSLTVAKNLVNVYTLNVCLATVVWLTGERTSDRHNYT